MTNMIVKSGIVFTSLISITILELTALNKGIDGQCFSIAIGGICVIAGMYAKNLYQLVRKVASAITDANGGKR